MVLSFLPVDSSCTGAQVSNQTLDLTVVLADLLQSSADSITKLSSKLIAKREEEEQSWWFNTELGTFEEFLQCFCQHKNTIVL